jgi:phosphatidylglycerol---prolipoprotein diacylglyceryl transferase
VSYAAGPLLAYIPSPPQGVWHVGPIPIRAYALCIIVGIIVAIWWGERRFAARGGAKGTVVDIAVWAVPFGLVGGRLYHVATDWWRYFGAGKDWVGAFKIWDGGLGIPGAIALGALGAWIACRRKGIPLPFMADAVAPAIVTAQAIGRVGNYFNQELFGGTTTLPWGLEIFQRVNPTTGLPDNLDGVAVNTSQFQVVHPTFLYELIWDLLIALLVVVADRRFRLGHGRAFALYAAGYAFGRFWIELVRTDQATQVFGVRINVWTMSLIFICAVVYFILARRCGPREDPATFPGTIAAELAEKSAVDTSDVSLDSDTDEKAETTEPAENTEPADTGETEDEASEAKADADEPAETPAARE